jgi:pimeloyl-ACP methyl ester carboxylesterase
MDERFLDVGDVTLCYETFGSPEDPALLLVMGLGTQMLAWPEDFCRTLAGRGFYVIRYDNRDTGRSTVLRGHEPPGVLELATRRIKDPAYTLDDMADDGIRLLDGLGIRHAHVVGASMGGMIAQVMAARHQDRVRSLTSIMATTGGRRVGNPSFRIYPIFVKAAPKEEDAYVEHVVKLYGLIGSPGFARDDDELRATAHLSFRRGVHAAGTGRQLGAIIASGDRTELVRTIRMPALVIHGTADKMVSPSGGRATAEAIEGATLLEIEGMGHDLPRGAWNRIITAIAENAAKADGREALAA